MIPEALNIDNYLVDGFARVCTVANYDDNYWRYENVNTDLMFSEHRSWIYFIVVDNEIAKVGETGNPLGIRPKTLGTYHYFEDNPLCNTNNRLGRYRLQPGEHDTDQVCRSRLREDVERGVVSIWAKKCPLVNKQVLVQGKKKITTVSMHKDLEMVYLDNIFAQTGALPRLNKARK